MGALAFSIDLDRCIGCRACVAACAAGNELVPGATFITVSDVVRPRGDGLWGSFAHHRCFHCADAACVEACPTGTLSKVNGLTAVDAARCSGCGYCVDACPYHVPEVQGGRVSKCVGCTELARDGQAPWCERTCPNQAIRLGPRDAVVAEARERVARLRARHPNAQVYGEAQLGGLGLVVVLLERPEVYGLPDRPAPPSILRTWRAQVRPASVGATAAAALLMGGAYLYARRQRVREHEGPRPGDVARARDDGEGGDHG
jgi:formate dehydrogenase iron-sulfur subunit